MDVRQLDVWQRSRSFGWWSLLCWLTLGMALEALHGFKLGWYLDVGQEARRLQLTLAHSHGTLLALVNLLFAATLRDRDAARLVRAGLCLRTAGVLMPVGFLGGGLWPLGNDPGVAVVLVPLGGLLLFCGVLLVVLELRSGSGTAGGGAAGGKGQSGR
jgi:hypothetical protein